MGKGSALLTQIHLRWFLSNPNRTTDFVPLLNHAWLKRAWSNAHRILEKRGLHNVPHMFHRMAFLWSARAPTMSTKWDETPSCKGALPHRNVGSDTHALKCEKISELLPAFELLLYFHTHVTSSCVCSLHPYNTGISKLDLMLDPV